jgi:amidase
VGNRPAAAAVASSLRPDALRGARIGVAREGFGFNHKVLAIFDEAVAALRSAGAVLVDPAELPSIDQLGKDEFELFLYELKDGVEKYLASRGSSVAHRTMHDIIAFNEANRDRELRFFGQEYLIQAAAKGPLTEPRYQAIRRRLLSVSRGNFGGVLTRHRLDAVVCMTAGPAWTIDPVNGDHFEGGSSTYPAVSGYPNVTVPAGRIHGLPVGLSFFGRAWTDDRLLGFAYAFERTTQTRVKPAFRATIPS